jgi:ankyrin repeat protein
MRTFHSFDTVHSECHRHVRQLDDELQATPQLQNAFLRLATSKHKMNLWSTIHPPYFDLPSGSIFRIDPVDRFSLPLIFGFNSFPQALIDHGPSSNGRVNCDKSPLLTAIEFQKETLVRCLVENGADVNAQGGFYGNPLQAAATTNIEIVRYLIENGADVNAQGGFYGNPLQAAVNHGHVE